jgi:hypothetical protein
MLYTTIFRALVMTAVAIIVGFSAFKEIKALLSFKKMPEFINAQSKPVITNSIVLTVLGIMPIFMSLLFWNNYLFFVFMLVSCLIGIETIFFIDDELHNIIGK